MNEKNVVKERIVGLDILKVLAMLFVVILHVNGYCKDLKFEFYSQETQAVYYVIEAVAYPAIHLFVLVGSYFMITKKPSQRQYLKIYVPMWFITMIGMLVIGVIRPKWLSIELIIQCVFPFLSRAYWFVSEYMVLVLLSPILNYLLNHLEYKVLIVGVVALTFYVVVFPTLQFFDWNGSNLDLFILLYLYAGLIHKKESSKNIKKVGLCLWMFSCCALIGSVYFIKYFSKYMDFFVGREMQFYSYSSIPVIFMAIGLFMFFKEIKIRKQYISKIFAVMSGSSLITYMYHMHPILKLHYTEMGLLRYINVNEWMKYMLGILGTSVLVAGGGVLLGIILMRILYPLINLLDERISKFKEKYKQNLKQKIIVKQK